jgi:hypothetical protein
MAAPAPHSAYDAFDADERYRYGELSAGERIGQPPRRTGSRALLASAVVVLIALGAGWALLGDPVNWQASLAHWPSIEAAVSAWMSPKASRPTEPATLAMATTNPPASTGASSKPSALSPPPTLPPVASDPPTAPRAAAPPVTAALPPAAKDSDEPAASPLPPPAADPADPYQMRAMAVGLHPDLSRVLLARLSPTDYRNAGVAIETAVAETPDGGTFVWPRQRKPELALFKVHFVPGAAPGCRRYVVTVTKDGWLTTALPMEKCGVEPRRAQRK